MGGFALRSDDGHAANAAAITGGFPEMTVGHSVGSSRAKAVVVHVVPSMALEDGGPSYSVSALVRSLNRLNHSSIIRTVKYDNSNMNAVNGELVGYRMHGTSIGLKLKASTALRDALTDDGEAGAIFHAHGLWLMPNVYPAWVKQRWPGRVRLVHSVHGMLGGPALKISTLKKRVFWMLLQRAALSAADCLHATAEAEYEEIRARGLRAPVAIIPHGIDMPDISDLARPTARERTILSLGRIHPKKGLDRLVRAWASLECDHPDWRVRIVGPAERGHDTELRGMITRLGIQRMSVEGPVYGEARTVLYRAADVFVLPTLHENFSMTVAEALASEVPVISTKGAPWQGLETERCGWWIEQDTGALAKALVQAMRLPRSELFLMGERGRSWMARDFGWRSIAKEMSEVYTWLSGRGPMPQSVRSK